MNVIDHVEPIPHGEIHQIQITEKNLYAVDELFIDTIYDHYESIADFRKKLAMPSDYPDHIYLLSAIEILQGKIEIIKDMLDQLGITWER